MATTITANGINFPDGSASAPSIGGTDTNTGLFTGSDLVGFATGGVERIKIDAQGDIFIGTTSDIAPANGTNLCVSDGTISRLILEKQSTIKFGLNVSNGFSIYDETNDAQRFGIDSSGNVTIGGDGDSGSNPSAGYDELCIEGGNEDIGMCFLSPAANNVTQQISFGDSNNNQVGRIKYNHASDYMSLGVGGGTDNERLRIDSSGRVLIGTTTEGHADADDLTIATSASTGITLRCATNGAGSIFFSDGTSGIAEYDGFIQFYHADQSLRFGLNNAERFRITSGGDVCIGRNSQLSDAKVSIQCDTAEAGIAVQLNASSGTSNLIQAYSSAGPNVASICVNPDSSPDLLFKVHDGSNTVERLRLDSSGHLQFRNTTSSHQGLKWYSHTGHLGVSFTYGEGNANPTLNIFRWDSQSGFPYGNLIINTGHSSSPTQALKLRTDKHIELAGSLIMANGNGIDFSATSDATGKTSELLDDYEEGNLTWYLRKHSSTSTGNDNGSLVKYTKVGRMVLISGRIRTDSVPSDANDYFYLDGSLPFTPSTPGTSVVGHWRSQDQLDSSLTASIAWGESNTTIYLYTIDSKSDYSPAQNNVPASHQTNLVMTFSFSYIAS